MNAIFLEDARYVENHKVFLRFNHGVQGEADLKDVIDRYRVAAPLSEPAEFAKFHLDSWPTLCWECGFDIAPEALYQMVIDSLSRAQK